MRGLSALTLVMLIAMTGTGFGQDGTVVSAEDTHNLQPQEHSILRIERWDDGVAIRLHGRPWLKAKWPDLKVTPLESPGGGEVVDLWQRGPEQFLCVRNDKETSILHRNGAGWETMHVPEPVSRTPQLVIIPSDKHLAVATADRVWWHNGKGWIGTVVPTCPSTLRGGTASIKPEGRFDPTQWGDSRFIRYERLYASADGGEWGSIMSRYDLTQDNGPWKVVWRDMHAVRMLQDQQGALWMLLHLAHRIGYGYKLERTGLRAWEQVIGSQFVVIDRADPGIRAELSHDSLVCDMALTAGGKIALLAKDEGVFLVGKDSHPCLLHFDFHRVPSANPTSTVKKGFTWSYPEELCFDASDNVYVTTRSLGILVFHRSESGPWRVRQVALGK